MSARILHISDLHFRAPSEHDKNIYYSDSNFCDDFIKYINNNIGNIDYLIFTGDAINQGYVKAFDDAKKFLEELITKLNIRKDRILLCMGNHDFDRHELELEAKEIPADAINKQKRMENIHASKAKYKYFKSFVKDITGKDLDVQDAIYDSIVDENNRFILMGVNTCYIESFDISSHKGMIDKDQFTYKLNSALEGKSDYNVFLAMHHNPASEAPGNEISTWKDILKSNTIKNPIIVFSGHIHYIETSYGEQDEQEGYSSAETSKPGTYYFSAGSLLNKEYKARSFNIYEVENSKITYHFHTHIESGAKPYWEETKEGNTIMLSDRVFLPDSRELDGEKELPGEPNSFRNEVTTIMNYIGDHKLYYSGHFHWNTDETTGKSDFKSHGYIDINYLVSHIESLEIITRLFEGKITEIKNQYKETFGKTLLVSIGMECNVIGARLSVLFPKFDYSYIPRKRKAGDHDDIEIKIGLDIKDYDTIIIIKDIMGKTRQGETEEIIRDLFYGKNVYVVSLFYCGDATKKEGILKSVDKAHFYSLIDEIKILMCDVPDTECPIIKNKLQTIYRC